MTTKKYSQKISLAIILDVIRLNIGFVLLVFIPLMMLSFVVVIISNQRQVAKYNLSGMIQVNNNAPLNYSDLPTFDSSDNSKSSMMQVSAENSEIIYSLLTSEYILDNVILDNHLDFNIAIIPDNSFSGLQKRFFSNSSSVNLYPDVEYFDIESSLYNNKFILSFHDKSKFTLLDFKTNSKILDGNIGESVYFPSHRGVMKITSYNGDISTKFVVVRQSLDVVEASLLKDLDIEPVIIMKKSGQSDTGLITISMSGANPKKQTKIINDIMQQIKEKSWERQRKSLKQMIDFLDVQSQLYESALNIAQKNVILFQSEHSIFDLSAQSKQDLIDNATIEQRIMDKDILLLQYSHLYTSEHPLIQSINNQKFVLTQKHNELMSKLNRLPKEQAEYASLENEVEVNKTLYLSLLTKKQSLTLKYYGINSPIDILSYASPSVAPIIKPLSAKVLVMNILMILILEIIIVVYFVIFTPGDPYFLPTIIESKLLAIIPHFTKKDKNKVGEFGSTHPKFNPICALFASFNREYDQVFVCNFGSIGSNSGRYFVIKPIAEYLSINFKIIQISFATSGGVDIKTNFSIIEDYFKLGANKKKNLEVKLDLEGASDIESLDRLLVLCSKLFDYVFIITPSLIENPLFMNIAKLVDYNVIIATPKDTTELVEYAADNLENLDIHIDGVIFNHPQKPFLRSQYSRSKF